MADASPDTDSSARDTAQSVAVVTPLRRNLSARLDLKELSA